MNAMRAWSIRDVVIYTHRKWIWILKNHSHTFAQMIDVNVSVNILLAKLYFAGDPTAFYKIIHTVERF